MNLAAGAVKNRVFTQFAVYVAIAGGIFAYTQLGQLEDPEFTVKNASIVTTYPGANAAEVEQEVTDRIEKAIQEMAQVREIQSISRPGMSIVKLEMLPQYGPDTLPQVWDELRRKVNDVTPSLPPGVGKPVVNDDIGDVYGFVLAVTGDGFSYAELEKYVDDLKTDLSLVPGVARVELWGVQQQAIYIDVSQEQLSELGLTLEDIGHTLSQQNMVVDSGGIDLPVERLRISQTGAFQRPEDIANLTLSGRAPLGSGKTNDELLRIRDIATVRRGYVEPEQWEMRYNGQPAIGMAISNIPGENIVNLGHRIEEELSKRIAQLPVGLEVHRVAWQSDMVSESISTFVVSLFEAVAIVLVVLWLAMGFRVAMIVGLTGLVYTIIITFLVMYLWKIDLQRMSLGALIVAMGMMVDNAIVVVDGVMVRLKRGMDRTKAAIEAASAPAMPLLGATGIAVMAFYPIYASTEGAGEYCASLFQVVGASLLISWVLSVTIVPVMCISLLPTPKISGEGKDQFDTPMLNGFRRLLSLGIRWRWGVVTLCIVMLGVALYFFKYVDRSFFPDSARPQLMVDYWAPAGTKIQHVSEELQKIENHLQKDGSIDSISTFVGQGPPRFYLPVEPELPYPFYGQLIINLKSSDDLDGLIKRTESWLDENVSDARTVVRRYGLGPSNTWKLELRLVGPARASNETLRQTADELVDVFMQSGVVKVAQINWQNRTKKINLDYDQERARWTSLTRENIADATRRAYDGLPVGQFREKDKLLPILLRHTPEERKTTAGKLYSLQVHPTLSSNTVPLAQAIDSIDTEWEDSIIWRFNRHRTITVQANPADGVTADTARAELAKLIENIKLPPGYKVEWGGEYEDSTRTQKSLIPGMVPAVIIMALIVVGLFNAFRPPLIIVLTIPFVFIGITPGLLATGQSFGFLALLGAMSLAGMMTKNVIVLLDEINLLQSEGQTPYNAVTQATVSRLRPVVLAAGTTVLGVIPLLSDVFWSAMAITIMCGLSFGTLLTLVLVPVLYAIFFKLPNES